MNEVVIYFKQFSKCIRHYNVEYYRHKYNTYDLLTIKVNKTNNIIYLLLDCNLLNFNMSATII